MANGDEHGILMLTTPLGEIEITVDGEMVPYHAVKFPCDEILFPNLSGRYFVKIALPPDGQRHTIHCSIKNHVGNERDGVESGERLELKSFFKGSCKLSIGAEGDTGHYFEYDYDNFYTENGVGYVSFPNTKTCFFVFGIAWIADVSDENEVQTWYGADPTIITISM